MFRLVRFFAVANAIALIVAAAILYLLYRHIEVVETIRTAEEHNATLARTLANALSPVYERQGLREGSRGVQTITGKHSGIEVDSAIRSLVRGLPVVKVILYDANENIVYSADPNETGASGADDSEGFRIAMTGKPRSQVEFRSHIEGFEGPLKDRRIVETYTPFYSVHGTKLGVFELYSDVSPRMDQIDNLSAALLACIAVLFCLLYAGLMIAIRHAQRIIAGQYNQLENSRATLDTKNERLLVEIAHRNEIEAELRRARSEAEHASQTKSRFLANMSHELRTPLNAVIGFSEIIADQVLGPVHPERYRDYASDIRESGQYLLALVDDILDLSKIGSGGQKLDLEPCDMKELIRMALKTTEPQCQRNGNEVFVEAPDSAIEIVSDKSKVLGILTNLVGNAAKFTRNGRIAIKVRCEPATDRIGIEISDNGIGMHTERVDSLFEDFTQHDNLVTRVYGGTGLGLKITRHYCEMLNGEFRIESEIGKGTSVTVNLPACLEMSEETRVAAE